MSKFISRLALVLSSIIFTVGIMVFTEFGSTNFSEKGFYVALFCGIVFYLMMTSLIRNSFK